MRPALWLALGALAYPIVHAIGRLLAHRSLIPD